jgi:hypothetical protein
MVRIFSFFFDQKLGGVVPKLEALDSSPENKGEPDFFYDVSFFLVMG